MSAGSCTRASGSRRGPGDVVEQLDRDEIRRNRADLEDAGRRLNTRGYGAKIQQFELDTA